MPQSKHQLRSIIAAKRKTLDAHCLAEQSAGIVSHLLKLDAFQSAKTVALYKAIDGEVDLEPLFSRCWKMGKQTAIPVFNAKLKLYEMATISAETEFTTGKYGIQEPTSPTLIPLDYIDLMAVPGVAFDAAGNRIGRGGGYYDRLLEGFPGFSVAVAFDFQLFSHVPCEVHDIPVDGVITPTKIIPV